MRYAWLGWSLALLAVWGVLYATLKDAESRREMLRTSLWTSLLGFTEPLFVPVYWNPPSLFDLAARTGFDIESILFAFGVGGIAAVLYERVFRIGHRIVRGAERERRRHWYHPWAPASPLLIFFALMIATERNFCSRPQSVFYGPVFMNMSHGGK